MHADFGIIDKTKPPKPRYVYQPVPENFKSTYEAQKYFEEQKRRWIEGYAGLTGPHYFYLQEGYLKAGTHGEHIRPVWRDVDEFIFEGIDISIKRGYECGVVKRREVGLTSIGAGALPNYFMRVYPGSTSIMTSCDKPRIFKMFNDKTAVMFDNMDKRIKPKVINRNQTKNNVYIKAMMPTPDGRELESDIYCSETVDNPKAFSGTRAAFGFFDEFPLHPYREEVMASSESCFMQSGVKTGFLLWGGTVEADIPPDKMVELKKIIGDAKGANRHILFIPAWMGLDKVRDKDGNIIQLMVNGHSDRIRGTQWVEEELERREKLESKKSYLGFRKNYPLTIEVALEIDTGGIIPQEVMETLDKQEKLIKQNPPPINTYSIKRGDDGPYVVPSKFGQITILTHPEFGHVYIAGMDPRPFNDAKIKGSSEQVITIKDYTTQTYVAYYASMDTADMTAETSIMLQEYYNNAPVMLERNVGGVMLEKYKELGKAHLLADQPATLGINFVDKRVKKGYFKNDHTSARGNDLLIRHLMQYAQNVWFERIINELRVFLEQNTDLVDAMIACEFLDAEITKRKKIATENKPQYKEIPTIERDSSGKTKMVIKKVKL